MCGEGRLKRPGLGESDVLIGHMGTPSCGQGEQKCIPVGCVPSATVAVLGGCQGVVQEGCIPACNGADTPPPCGKNS